ncbi:MAG: sigma-70 family RNA polymerase sigma factor, partial [Bryobacteraceae bacterium]
MNAGATKPALATLETESGAARRDELILEYLPLVSAIAAHIQRSLPVHIELDDLIHAGTMGLFEAATHYQPEKQIAFPTYAKHRIRGAILDSLRQIDWASRDLRKRYKQMETVIRQLTTELRRTPTEAEVAAAMGLNARRWQSLMVDFRAITAAAMH